MKKVLLSSVAVLSIFAAAPVLANSNAMESNVNNDNLAGSELFNAPKAAEKTQNPVTKEEVPQMDKAPKDGYVENNDKNPLTTIGDATGDIHGYYHYEDNGSLSKVDLSGSQNLTPKGEDTYKKYFGHRQGVEGARTNGAEAYKHDQEFLASKGLPTDAVKPAAPTMSQSAKDAEKAAEKMSGNKSSEGKSNSSSKTLPNTAAAK